MHQMFLLAQIQILLFCWLKIRVAIERRRKKQLSNKYIYYWGVGSSHEENVIKTGHSPKLNHKVMI